MIVRIALSLVLLRQLDSRINLSKEIRSLSEQYLQEHLRLKEIEQSESDLWKRAIFGDRRNDDYDLKKFRQAKDYKSRRFCLSSYIFNLLIIEFLNLFI